MLTELEKIRKYICCVLYTMQNSVDFIKIISARMPANIRNNFTGNKIIIYHEMSVSIADFENKIIDLQNLYENKSKVIT